MFIYLLCHAECLGTFDGFQSVGGGVLLENTQYIMPQLNFFCNGTVTQWKVGLQGGGINREVNLQIWRSVGVGEYSRVTEAGYTKRTEMEETATVSVSMSVMAGDMVGFNGQLQLQASPNVGLTILSSRILSTSLLSSLSSTVGPSPYITAVFGEMMLLFMFT